MLVEIAVWWPVLKILQKAQEVRGENCREEDARKVRDILLNEDSDDNHPRDIAFRMGDRFLSISELACGESGIFRETSRLLW